MLRNFFRLDEPFREVGQIALLRHFETPENLRAVFYEPENWPSELKKVSDRTFTNVSLSKTTFSRMTFTNCVFEDCLFIGSRFDEVEFHHCKFINCNFYKVVFQKCYIDPSAMDFDKTYKTTAANVAVNLYQALLENSYHINQFDFVMEADIRLRRWKRAQLTHDRETNRISSQEAKWRFTKSVFYEHVAGFGYKPQRFFISTIALFLLISVINYYILSGAISNTNGDSLKVTSFVDSVFYSFSILTVLGFSSIVPTTSVAKLITVAEALISIGWLGIYTSLLVKRFIR